MASTAVVVSGVLAAVYISLWAVLYITQDAKEPPLVVHTVPFVGPVIGMIREKSQFYLHLREKYKLPIYTLRLPFSRVYVINATELIPAMQKQWRTISFAAITAHSGAVVGIKKKSLEIMNKDLTKEDSFSMTWPSLITPVLGPGQSLDRMNRTAIEVLAADLTKLKTQDTTSIGLWDFTNQAILVATTDAVYGPLNPYRDAAVAKAWKTFESGFLTLALSPLPDYFSSDIYRARELVAAALLDYVRKSGCSSASGLVQARYEHHVNRFGFDLDDVARGELGNTFAVLGNTGPCAWWLIYHIYSDPKVLADVRTEVSSLVQEEPGESSCSVDLASIRTSCPILLSTFQEMMRYRSISTSVRVCLEDAMLDGRYLLKKGSMVMVPNPVQHFSVSAWGDTADKFDHRRFIRVPGQKGPNKVAFRAFGGGHDLCPGRHFASTEIMAFAALMVLQFDITPTLGRWVEPTWEKSPMVAGFPAPDEDIKVAIRSRDDRKWNVTFSGSEKVMEIVSEDITTS